MNVISNVILSKYKIQCKCKPISDRQVIIHVVVQSPSPVRLLATPGTAGHQASLTLTLSRSLPKFKSIASVMPPSHLILWPLFSSCPQSFPESGTFPMSRLFTSGDQNPGASVSASDLSMSIQDWFPLRLTAWISLQPKGLWGVFSSTTVRRHQFFSAWPSLQSSSHNCVCPLGRP